MPAIARCLLIAFSLTALCPVPALAESPTGKPEATRPIKDKWAVVVGVSRFADSKINLRYPAKDARDFYDYLVNEGNFKKDHVVLLTDEEATRIRILSALGDKWLPHLARPDDLVVVYISSHGSPADMDVGGLNYIVAHDTSRDCLYATAIPLQELMRIVKSRVLASRIILILDACHSGAASPEAKGLYRAANVDAARLASSTGQLVIASSSPDQVSWEGKQYANSVFTYHLLKALKENGAATTIGDAFESMRAGIQEEVLRDRGILQTPELKSEWQGQTIALAAPPVSPRKGMPEIVPVPVKPLDLTSENLEAKLPPSTAPTSTRTWSAVEGDSGIESLPAIPPVIVLDNGNIYRVYNKPSRATTFNINYPGLLTYMFTYHWNDARGARPGTISLKSEKGYIYGPFKTTGKAGQGNVPNAYWECEPLVRLPAGTYTIIDSDPSSWAQNEGSRGAGFARVRVAPLVTTSHPDRSRELKRSPETAIYNNGNIYGCLNNPLRPTNFSIDRPALITKITNYHWNNGRGRVPGRITLLHSDGTRYGPWQANGRSGQAGAPEVYWDCPVDLVIKPGFYTVIDSDPPSWSHNPQNGGAGMTEITGVFQ